MNLFELGFFLAMISVVMLWARELKVFFSIPEALTVLPIVGVVVLLLHVFTGIRARLLLYASALVAVVSFLSIGLAKAMDVRESIYMILLSTVLVLILIRGTFLTKRYFKAPDPNGA